MRFRVLGPVAVGIIATTFACSTSSDRSASSDSAHTVGEFVWTNDEHGWADVDRATVDAYRDQEKAAAETDVTTKRLQGWVDRYDAIVRGLVQGLKAPAPHARVVVAPEIGSSPTLVPACIATTTTTKGQLPQSGHMLVELGGIRTTFAGFHDSCMTAKNWTADTGLSWFNGLGGYTVVPDTDGIIRIRNHVATADGDAGATAPSAATDAGSMTTATDGGDSDAGVALDGDAGDLGDAGPPAAPVNPDQVNPEEIVDRAANVSIQASAPFVNINAGFIGKVSERTIAIAVAHELARYYRTHGTVVTGTIYTEGKYDFFYDRTQNVQGKPTPVANQADWSSQYGQLKLPRFLVPGAKFHPRIVSTLFQWVTDLHVAPGHVCEPLTKSFAALPAGIRDELVEPWDSTLSGVAAQAYLGLQARMSQCFNAITLTNDAIPSGDFTTTKIPRAWFASRLVAPIKTQVAASSIASAHTLQELVTTLETAGKKLDTQAPDFLKKLADNRIGYYTAEQEADELSVELATRLGFKAEEVMAAYIEQMYAIEKQDPQHWLDTNGLTAKQCEDLVKAGFHDQNQRQIYVAIGTLSEHTYCYRLMNLQQEITTHAYVPGTPTFPTDPTPWTDVQDAAAKLLGKTDTPPATTTPSDPHAGEPTTPPLAAPGGSSDEEPASAPAEDPSPKAKPAAGGCSTSSGSSSGSWSWMLGLAAALGLVRRRKSA